MKSRILFKSSTKPTTAPAKGAARYFIVRFWVDAVGRKPTWDEVRAAPDSTPVPQGLRAAQINPLRDLQRAIDDLPQDQRKVPALIVEILEAT